MDKKQQAQLEKRSKELDAREEYLNKWESELKSAPLDLKILKSTITAKQTHLNGVIAATERLEKRHSERVVELEAAEKIATTKFSDVNAKLEELDRQMETKKTELYALKDELKTVTDEIAERKTYLKDQEHLIADKTEEGNNLIIELQAEIRDYEGQRQVLEDELSVLDEAKTDSLFEQARLNDELSSHKISIDDQEQKLLNNLESLKVKIGEANQKLEAINREVDSKLQTLKVKEEELLTKRDAIRNDRLQLEEDKRRWTSTKSLYQL